jgi:Mg2+/Co2+ transporter CorC
MADLLSKLADMHEELVEQVLDDLRNGDRKARAEALALLKQSNITAVAQEGSTLSKLAGKLDFSSMEGKVVALKRPPATGLPQPEVG